MKPPPRLVGDVTGFFGHGVENAIALASGGIEIVRFQGEAMADPATLGCYQTSPGPPGAVVVPEVVVRVQCATGDELQMCGGHGFYDKLVFKLPIPGQKRSNDIAEPQNKNRPSR